MQSWGDIWDNLINAWEENYNSMMEGSYNLVMKEFVEIRELKNMSTCVFRYGFWMEQFELQ